MFRFTVDCVHSTVLTDIYFRFPLYESVGSTSCSLYVYIMHLLFLHTKCFKRFSFVY